MSSVLSIHAQLHKGRPGAVTGGMTRACGLAKRVPLRERVSGMASEGRIVTDQGV